ncbi:hypothetical protein IFM89_019752 [Coptis chinensis]|uniref:Uncharacterized protein n=1 Tax=Coptis chinensis TaxID=261450 RepID=A0A835H691_9MAGN|nr:hypothetical protein IFM89_019752 [Coptis chinensis]
MRRGLNSLDNTPEYFGSVEDVPSLESTSPRSEDCSLIYDVKSLAWGHYGDANDRHKDASFREFLFVYGDRGIPVHIGILKWIFSSMEEHLNVKYTPRDGKKGDLKSLVSDLKPIVASVSLERLAQRAQEFIDKEKYEVGVLIIGCEYNEYQIYCAMMDYERSVRVEFFKANGCGVRHIEDDLDFTSTMSNGEIYKNVVKAVNLAILRSDRCGRPRHFLVLCQKHPIGPKILKDDEHLGSPQALPFRSFPPLSVIIEYEVREKSTLHTWMRGGLDYIMLHHLDIDRIHIIGSVLGQSIALDYYVSQLHSSWEWLNEVGNYIVEFDAYTGSRMISTQSRLVYCIHLKRGWNVFLPITEVHLALTPLQPVVFFGFHRRMSVTVVGTIEGGKAPTKIKTNMKKPIVNLVCHPWLPVLAVDTTIKLIGAGAFAFHPTSEWIFVGDRRGTLLAWDVSIERPNMIGIGFSFLEDFRMLISNWSSTRSGGAFHVKLQLGRCPVLSSFG